MKILILGWYGSETIGDRAIFAGLIQLLSQSLGDINFTIGSLNPFFTERTLIEDIKSINDFSQGVLKFKIINSKKIKELKTSVLDSDLIVMGGGPLMDLEELSMIEYAFIKAKKNRIKTAILGCGVGPLFKKNSVKSIINIFKNSDIVVVRDSSSYGHIRSLKIESKVMVAFDPSVHFVSKIVSSFKNTDSKDYIAVNLRSFPCEYNSTYTHDSIDQKLVKFIDKLSIEFPNNMIKMIPMHYFDVGNDDRYFLNKIKFTLNRENIEVQNTPLTLEETIKTFSLSMFNIGMRYHSVILQTVGNGRNYILDYTEPKKGKIQGFINDIDNIDFYKERYINLQNHEQDYSFNFSNYLMEFNLDSLKIERSEKVYLNAIKELC